MKVNINIIPAHDEEEVHFHVHAVSEAVTQAMQLLTGSAAGTVTKHLMGKQDDAFYKIEIKDIFYVESIERRLFIYTGSQTYELADKLYVLEEQLSQHGFVRISKSMLLNLNKIHSFYPKLSGNLEAVLLNKEKVSISRRYVPDVKKQLGMREA